MDIKYAIVKNEMPASATEAKYLGKIIPNGVRNRTQMTALALKGEHFAEATFAAVVDAAVDVTKELCAEGRDVDWGPVKFLSKMHGSLPYEDSSFADGTASLKLDADATNATRAVLDTLVPVKVSAAEIDSLVKVSNVMDVATEAFGTVVGSTEFAVLGNGITLDGEGEYVKALDKKTGAVKGTATVLRVSKGQRAYAKFNPQLAGGDYTFEIATKGLLGETTPRIFHKPVTAVYVAPTTAITKVTQTGRPDDTVLMANESPCVVHGTDLALGANDKVLMELYENGVKVAEGDLTANGKVTSTSDAAINLSGFWWNDGRPDGDWWDAYPDSKLVVVKNGVRCVHPLTFKGE